MLFDKETIEEGKHVKEHWRKITLKMQQSEGPRSCAYCKLYRKETFRFLSCQGCPINYFTERDGCQNTPYQKYNEAKRNEIYGDVEFYAGKMKILVDEIFIKSLLLFDIRSDYFNKENA